MKQYALLIYPLFSILCCMAVSCKKENNIYPNIAIISPNSGQNFSYGDTIAVKLKVERLNGRIGLDILDGNQSRGFEFRLIHKEDNIYHYQLYFTDRYLNSGTYDLRAQAFNGENKKSDFVQLHLQELELMTRGIVALSRGSGNFAEIIKYDSLGNASGKGLTGDFNFMVYNSFQQRIIAAPQTVGELTGMDYENLNTVYTVSNSDLPGSRQYEYLFNDFKSAFTLNKRGYVKGYNEKGAVVRSFEIPQNFIPQTAVMGEPGMLISAKEEGKENYKIFLLNPQNGAVLKQAPIAGRVTDMVYSDNGIYTIAYKENGMSIIANFYQGTLTQFAGLSDPPLDMLAVNKDLVLISTTAAIYSFNPHVAILPKEIYTFAASDMAYDVVNNRLYFASGLSVLSSNPGGVPSELFFAGDSIRQVEVAYNK